MSRLVVQTGALHAGFGAMRRTARGSAATTHAAPYRTRVNQLVVIDRKAPQEGAKAP